jgi:hypothetical protein
LFSMSEHSATSHKLFTFQTKAWLFCQRLCGIHLQLLNVVASPKRSSWN